MYFGQLARHGHFRGYVLSDLAIADYTGQDFFVYKNSAPYYAPWIELLEKIEEDFFIYMQDDFILYNDVDHAAMERYVEFLKTHGDYGFARLIRSGDLGDTRIQDDIYEIEQDSPNLFAMQATIWRKESFIDIYKEAKADKWNDEQRFIDACRKLGVKGVYVYSGEKKRGMAHWDSNVFPYIATALVKGKWNIGEYPDELEFLLAAYGIDISDRNGKRKKGAAMEVFKQLKIQVLSRLTANKFMQKRLRRQSSFLQYLMGIGAGSDVSSSGEKTIFRKMEQMYSPPYCIFDVGANQGQFRDIALKTIKAQDFTIHSFEPGAKTFQILSSGQKDERVKLNNVGIGRERGEMTLYYDRPGSGLASLTKRKLDHFGIEFDRKEAVKIETIDNYCEQNHINRIHLLKVDIEGHELDAFAGAQKMFAAKAIDMVAFEFGGCNIDTRTFFQDFWYFFRNAQMDIFRITPSGHLAHIESYREFDEQYRTTNFVAMRKN